jgi:hypothetical protein
LQYYGPTLKSTTRMFSCQSGKIRLEEGIATRSVKRRFPMTPTGRCHVNFAITKTEEKIDGPTRIVHDDTRQTGKLVGSLSTLRLQVAQSKMPLRLPQCPLWLFHEL